MSVGGMRSLLDMLERAAKPNAGLSPLANAGDNRGVHFVDSKENTRFYSYEKIVDNARKVGAALRAHGVVIGDRIAIILPTGIDFYSAFFGALYAGAIPTALYPPLRFGRLDEYHQQNEKLLAAIDATLVISDKRVQRLLGQTIERARPRLGLQRISELLAEGRFDSLEEQRPSIDEIAFIQFSSGSTDLPKAIPLTHRQVLENIDVILKSIFYAYPENEKLVHSGMSWLPLYHDMGLVGCLLSSMYQAADLCLIPPELFIVKPAVWLRMISRFKSTVSPAPNFAFSLCLDRIKDDEINDVDLSCWKVALNGAEPVNPVILERFTERFAAYGFSKEALTPVYGLAEAALAVSFSSLKKPFRYHYFDQLKLVEDGKSIVVDKTHERAQAISSLGRPLEGFEISIVAEIEKEEAITIDRCVALGDRKIGRVLVRGPSLMNGYFNQDNLVIENGWLDTGDRGFLMDGELYLYGRAKDCIIIRGKNYAPQDIEFIVDDIEGVRKGCVLAIQVPEQQQLEFIKNDSLLVIAEASTNDKVNFENLEEKISQEILARKSLCANVLIVEAGTLPRTSSGKLRRQEARHRLELGLLTTPKKITKLNLIKALLRSKLAYRRAQR